MLHLRNIALLFIVLPLIAFSQAGESGLAVLKIGVGARAIGMGDAGVAGSTGASSMHYNPAIIAGELRPSLTVMHNSWIEDVNTTYLGIFAPLGGYSLGFHVAYTGVEGIEVREQPGPSEGDSEAQYISLGGTVAMPVTSQIEVGATVKYLYEKIFVEDATGYAFDLGVRYSPFTEGDLERVSFGAAYTNLGTMSELNLEATELPTAVRYGAAYWHPLGAGNHSLQAEVNGYYLTNSETHHLNVGVEGNYDGIAFLRAGYQTGYEIKGMTFGAGVAFYVMKFDFAYTPFEDNFGSATTISLSVDL